jgi:hypothetical protein
MDPVPLCESPAPLGPGLGSIELGVRFPALQLPAPGTYRVELLAGGRAVASRTLSAHGGAR